MRALIIGCGYVGIPLGNLLAQSGHQVFGLRRSTSADRELMAHHIQPLHADITSFDSLAQLAPDFDWVINTASSTQGGLDEYRAVYYQGTRNILAWLRSSPPRAYVYTSSTSVYAQNDGSLVTEQSPAEPDSDTSRVLRQTEDLLLQAHRDHRFPAIIMRTSGIYGPGRGHLFKQFLRGEAVLRDDGSAYINMVHVQDVAGAIAHALTLVDPGPIFNLTDDQPVTQLEFFTWLAARLNKPLPPSAPPDPHRKRGLTNKRLSNARLKSTGYEFFFPTYREGYTSEMRRLGLISS